MSLEKVHDIVSQALEINKNNLSGSSIDEIHSDIDVRYNSVNVIVGKQSMGKTVIALQEIIKISLLSTHHLLIYVTKNGDENDKSWQSLKTFIQIPYIVVSEKNCKDAIQELISAKNLYYMIKRENLEEKIDDGQMEDMFQVLHVHDFSKDTLHTLILFDDIANSKLFAAPESYFSQQLRRCRHTNISYFLLIQSWKGLAPHIKNEITTLFIFPCFNKQQLHFIYSQSASNLTFEEFYDMYKTMSEMKNKRPYMIVHVTEGGETMVRAHS